MQENVNYMLLSHEAKNLTIFYTLKSTSIILKKIIIYSKMLRQKINI
jgi:hypothetical protein